MNVDQMLKPYFSKSKKLFSCKSFGYAGRRPKPSQGDADHMLKPSKGQFSKTRLAAERTAFFNMQIIGSNPGRS